MTFAGEITGDLSQEVDRTVQELRRLREASLEARRQIGAPNKLPSRRKVGDIVEKLISSLFPNRLSSRNLSKESVDYFVGQTLDTALLELVDQIVLELRTSAAVGVQESREEAEQIAVRFVAKLPEVRVALEQDLIMAYESDPAASSVDEVLACYPGVLAIIYHRIAHAIHECGATLVSRIVSDISRAYTGIEIHPAAKIAPSFFIDHGTGVVIGETTVIGERVRLHQAVTLGALPSHGKWHHDSEPSLERHPILESDVVVYAGATLLGRITVGTGSVIGGNVCLTNSVPPHSRIIQAKALVESFDNGLGI